MKTRNTAYRGNANGSALPIHPRLLGWARGGAAVGLVFVVLGLCAACGAGGQEAQARTSPADAVSDAEAGGIVLTAFTTGISSGYVALKRSSAPEVQALARMMIAENIALDMQALTVLKKLSLESVKSPVSSRMERQAKEALSDLAATDPGEFDRAYVTSEIAHRRRFLRILDETLIPGASDQEIRLLLLHVRSIVRTHLEHLDYVDLAMVLKWLPTDRFPSGSAAILG